LRDRNALVRLGALQSMQGAAPNERAPLIAPLLSDPLRVLRIEAASLLAATPVDQLRTEDRDTFERASKEYVESQRYNADRPEARVNLGTFYGNRGNVTAAEEEFRAAIRIDPFFVPAFVNLADLYRTAGRDADGVRVLQDGLKVSSRSGYLHHALGLAYVRLKRLDDALVEFERATVLEPANARFAYVYGVALHSSGRADAAILTLEKALTAHPGDTDLRAALDSFKDERARKFLSVR